MNTKGRRLWMHAAGMFTGMLFLGMTCETTVFAEGVTQADRSGTVSAGTETIQTDMLTAAAQEAAAAVQKATQEAALAQQKAAQEAAQAAALAQQEAALAQQKAAQEAAAQAAETAARQAAAAAQAAMEDAVLVQKGVSRQEYDLLAALIQCEAGGESYIGQVAVGNVVMNRTESGKHPDNITDVVYEPGQFSPVRNGSLKRTLGSGNISASCRQAALEAIAGSEPVGDKLFFRRVNGRSGQVIGNHVFY
ncbi:MAG TPA: cell wall hydrolase [Candidatus Eisenbergiella pullistercoris]|uniref:Cell wall hydrolase n=1 Tax=Candidatus Eisenbergiella pullistercoris TaxID=2838555 RepID=A0A9D1YPL5_9FIRM|nr:cell wall hydrolase [Candidatus Eisenbergiella pullistercoris]